MQQCAATSRGVSDRLTTGERAYAEGLPAGTELCLVSAAAELIAVERRWREEAGGDSC